jgi:aldose 1-epimerase
MTHVLENDVLRLELAPGLGASIVNLQVRDAGTLHPVLRPSPEHAAERGSASPLASFTLAPFSNRLPGARFTWEGREYALRPTAADGTTQHGDVRNRPHRTVSVGRAHAEYLLDSREVPDFNFPFAMTLSTTYELLGPVARQTLRLTNVSGRRAPFGLGVHPYFVRTLGGASDVELSFEARGVYVTDDTLVPTTAMTPVPPELDFRTPRAVAETALNTGYGGYGGLATLRYPGTPFTVRLRSSALFTHAILFTSPDGTLAVEPVSHATNAFNLHEAGVEGTGFTALEDGESLAGIIEFEVLREE